VAFLGGTNQIATFDNFTINDQTGDLIFADPSIATINFNNTVANAGTNNLLNATNGSVVTFNANASTLTGAIQTDSTSTTRRGRLRIRRGVRSSGQRLRFRPDRRRGASEHVMGRIWRAPRLSLQRQYGD
jgi:hypothetical protein